VDEVPVDVDESGLARLLGDEVGLPDLFVHSSSRHRVLPVGGNFDDAPGFRLYASELEVSNLRALISERRGSKPFC
jgi:hypothetical protein